MEASSLNIVVQEGLEAKSILYPLHICSVPVKGIWEKAKGPRTSTKKDSFRARRNLRGPGVQHFISSLTDEKNNEFRSYIRPSYWPCLRRID